MPLLPGTCGVLLSTRPGTWQAAPTLLPGRLLLKPTRSHRASTPDVHTASLEPCSCGHCFRGVHAVTEDLGFLVQATPSQTTLPFKTQNCTGSLEPGTLLPPDMAPEFLHPGHWAFPSSFHISLCPGFPIFPQPCQANDLLSSTPSWAFHWPSRDPTLPRATKMVTPSDPPHHLTKHERVGELALRAAVQFRKRCKNCQAASYLKSFQHKNTHRRLRMSHVRV